MSALSSRKANVVQKLLEYKVDMRPPADDRSLLGFALRMSSGETAAIVQALLKAGVDVNEHSGFLHQTPLFAAYNAPGAVKPLLAGGADIEARDDDGTTPLIRGAMVEAMVRELLAAGTDPTAVSNNGETALSVASKYDCSACAALIAASLKSRAQINLSPFSEDFWRRLMLWER